MALRVSEFQVGDRMRLARKKRYRRAGAMVEPLRDRGIDVKESTINAWERGATPPPLRVIEAWADITGYSAAWLAFGDLYAPRDSNPEPAEQGVLELDFDLAA